MSVDLRGTSIESTPRIADTTHIVRWIDEVNAYVKALVSTAEVVKSRVTDHLLLLLLLLLPFALREPLRGAFR